MNKRVLLSMSRSRYVKRIFPLVALVVLALVPVFFKHFFPSSYAQVVHISILMFTNIMLGVSLWIMLKTDEFSLGQAAFIALGGYTTGILVVSYHWSPWPTFILGGVVSAFTAFLLGIILVHLASAYFLLVTWGFAEILTVIFLEFKVPFRGAAGIADIPNPEGLDVLGDTGYGYYLLCLIFMFLAVTVIWRISNSKVGMIYKAIGEQQILASSCGIYARKYKLQVFALGCFFTGIVGAILSCYYTFIEPHTYSFWVSLDILMFNMVGGMSSIVGPIIGAVILSLTSQALFAAGAYKSIVYGFIIIFLMLFLPGGIISVPGKLQKRLKILSSGRR